MRKRAWLNAKCTVSCITLRAEDSLMQIASQSTQTVKFLHEIRYTKKRHLFLSLQLHTQREQHTNTNCLYWWYVVKRSCRREKHKVSKLFVSLRDIQCVLVCLLFRTGLNVSWVRAIFFGWKFLFNFNQLLIVFMPPEDATASEKHGRVRFFFLTSHCFLVLPV